MVAPALEPCHHCAGMTQASQTLTRPSFPPAAGDDAPAPPALDTTSANPPVPESWSDLREARDIQFEEITVIPPPSREPSWFSEWLNDVFSWLGNMLSPVAGLFGDSWPVMKWVLLALVIAFVTYLIARNVGLLARRSQVPRAAESEVEWQPTREESAALLEDADQLAAQGRFDEAVRLLLHRSVRQIAAAKPDWVEPSSTARELAALPALSERARTAFSTISGAVERSLFALRSLDASDWKQARAAYAEFALARIENAEARARQARA